MAYISRDGLKQVLFKNVAEVKSQRRQPISASATRRYFCVGAYPNFQNNPFLNTVSAQTTIRYKFPKGFPPYHPKPYYNPDKKNLVITWDIFMQDYRCINMDRCNLVRVWPVDTPEKMKDFWEYFNKHIINMATESKIDFMKR